MDVTLAIAVFGAALGIWNAARDWWRDAERLKVIPKGADTFFGEAAVRATLAIEVVNLSSFPVTVDEVGFFEKRSRHRRAIPSPITLDGPTLPRRLDPRSSVLLCANPEQDFSWIGDVSKAYATTATGRTFKGMSPRLRWMIKHREVPTGARRIAGKPGVVTYTEEPTG